MTAYICSENLANTDDLQFTMVWLSDLDFTLMLKKYISSRNYASNFEI